MSGIEMSKMHKEITTETLQELHDMLTGKKLPDCLEMSHQPRLTPEEADDVLWFLGQRTGLTPDHYATCDKCHTVFDDDLEGHYCENCGTLCEICMWECRCMDNEEGKRNDN